MPARSISSRTPPTFAKEPEGYATLAGGSFGEIRAEGALSGALVDDKVAGTVVILP